MASSSEYKHFVPPVPLNPHYRESLKLILIETLDQLKESFKKGYVMAWDTETTGLNPTESDIVGFSYSYDGITAYYCPVKHFDLALGKPALDLFYQALKDSKLQLLYNARFDIRMMEYSGYDMSFMYPKDPTTGQSYPKFIDVMNCSWLSDSNVLMPSLKASTLHFLGHQPPKFLETLGSEQNFQYVPARDAYEYACFSGDTLIQTKHGLKQIKELRDGELIQTSIGYRKLLSVLPQGNRKVICVTTPDKTSFICTPDHLFAFQIADFIFWVEAKDLDKISFYSFFRGGASLNNIENYFNYNMDLPSILKNECTIEYLEEEIPVYDLSIDGEHNFKLQCGLIAHNCEDAANTFNLFKVTYKYYKESGVAGKLDNQCVYIIGQLEKTPLNIDTDYLVKLRDDVYQYVQDTEKRIYEIAGHTFKIGSNRELTQVFLEQGIDTGERTKAGDMKTGIEVLNFYLREHPDCELLKLLIEYKEKFKLYNSYLKTLVDIAKQQDTIPPRFSYKLQSVPCLTNNNLVLLKDKGLVSIEDVREQDYIWTQYGYKRVLWNNSHKTKDVVRVAFDNGLFIEGTKHHPVLVNNGDENNIKLEWATLDDLKEGEKVVFNHHTPAIYHDDADEELLAFTYFLGVMFSPYLISELYNDDYYINKMIRFENALQSNKYIYMLKKDNVRPPNILEFITANKPICWVKFIQGLLSLIFNVEKAQQWNTDKDLSQFVIYADHSIFLTIIMNMLFYLGIPSLIRYDGTRCYIVLESIQALTLFKTIIVEDSDSIYLKELFSNYNTTNYYLEYADSTVYTKEYLEDELTVYDIEVEDVHEYVANGVVTHNTGRLSCLNKNSVIHTKQGLIPITEITSDHDIEVDYNRYSKGSLIKMGEKPFLKFSLDSGKIIECTRDHRFLCPSDTGYVWRYAQDLKEGDSVCRTRVTYKGYRLNLALFTYGFFLGDGSYYNSDKQEVVRLFFGEKDLDAMDLIKNYLDYIHVKSRLYKEKDNLWSLSIYKKALVILGKYFPIANVKQSERDIDFSWIHSKEDAFSVIAGVYQAEGEKYIRPSDGKMNSSLNVTSYKLVVSLQKLADYIGIRTRIHSIKIDHVKHPTHNPQWKLQFCVKSFRKYLNSSLPFRINTKKDVPKFLTESLNSLPKSLWSEGEHFKFKAMFHNKRYSLYSVIRLCEDSDLPIEVYDYEKITHIEDAGIQEAYTLSVEDSKHQYIAEGVINHNCGKDAKNTYFAPINLQCLEENTIIKTDNGNKKIKDVKDTDLVWVGDKFVPCKPLGFKKEYCYKIKTLWGEIEASLEHQFLTLNYQTYKLEFHTLKDCILNHYPLVRDPQSLGSSFDDIYHHIEYRSLYHLRKSLNIEEYKYYLDFYKDFKFDIIQECSREFWNPNLDPTWLKKTVYDLYVPDYNKFTANGFIVHNSIPKPKSIKCYGRKATPEEIENKQDILGWMFSPDHPEWSPGRVVEGMSDHLNVRKAFLPQYPENGDYVISVDMSAEELRIVTNLYKEKAWADVINSGGDLHHANSDAIFGPDNYTKETRKKAKCISGKSLVFTTKGIKKLEDLSDKRIVGEPQSIDYTIATPEGLCKATHFIYNGERETIKLYFKDGTTLEATPDHIVQSKKVLRKVEDLCIGDVVDIGSELVEVKDYQDISLPFITGCKLPITEDIAYLLGAILGDGSLNRKTVKYMSIDSELIEEIKRIVHYLNLSDSEPYYDDMYRKKQPRKIPVTYLNCGSKRFLILLDCLGINKNSHKDLIVPEIIFRSPSSVRGRFLRGLFDTDGWVGDCDFTIGFCSKSLSFTQDIHYLLLSLGILNTIQFSYNKIYKRDYYKIRIAQVSSRQFLEVVGFYNNKKRERLLRHLDEYKPTKARIPKKEIVKIEESSSEVFDLTIENKSHLFYANGCIVHNCAAFGMLYGQEAAGFQRKFPDMTLDEAKEFMAKFKQAIPNITRGQQRTLSEAKRTGTFYTAFGRPRRVKHYLTSSDYREQAFGKRTCMNGVIQGTAADVLKLEFVRLWDYLFTKYPEVSFICTIHDEINYSVPRRLVKEVIPIIIKCMTVRLPTDLVSLDCSLSAGNSLGNIIPFKYNFETKEFEPDWEEDTRKDKHDNSEIEENEPINKEEESIEEIDSKMFDL